MRGTKTLGRHRDVEGDCDPPKRTEIQRKGEKDSVRRKRSRKRKSEIQREEGGIDTQRKGWGERLREAG